MKKRILLSLVSFFAMTAMWASLVDAYKITVTADAPGKTYGTAELTLNMDNKSAISTWQCTLVLPEGVTFKSVAAVPARYPEAYGTPQIDATVNADGSVTFACSGEAGATLTGTAGAIATVTVDIAGTVAPGDYTLVVKNTQLVEPNDNIRNDQKTREYTWTIEEGEEPGIDGDLNGDNKVDIADAVSVLNIMASGVFDAKADLNNDGKIDVADFVSVLNIMAAQ